LETITRKTDKGLPQYLDAVDSDVFILSGAEDLVPVLAHDANAQRTVDGKTYRIRRYRPRIDGLFARIEFWTNTADVTDMFWRSICKDTITTRYGRTGESRIADLANSSQIFNWLICQSHGRRQCRHLDGARWQQRLVLRGRLDYGEHDASAPTERWFNSFKNERVHGECHTPAFAPR
jgi:hypothetical protein